MTTLLNTTTPNPGTKEALEKGCTCPVIDNNYGEGYMGQAGTFVYNMNCPVHTVDMTITNKELEIK